MANEVPKEMNCPDCKGTGKRAGEVFLKKFGYVIAMLLTTDHEDDFFPIRLG